jgi:hypothetical protein
MVTALNVGNYAMNVMGMDFVYLVSGDMARIKMGNVLLVRISVWNVILIRYALIVCLGNI